MSNLRARLGAVLLALACVTSLSACQKQTNTQGNPEVGKMTGAAVGHREVRMEKNAVNPDTTTIPTPSGQLPQQVPTVPEANLNIDGTQFMQNCRKGCNPDNSKDARHVAFCQHYCNCNYHKMDASVPVADLRAFARGENNPSTPQINNIIHQCAKISMDIINGRQPQASNQQTTKQKAGG